MMELKQLVELQAGMTPGPWDWRNSFVLTSGSTGAEVIDDGSSFGEYSPIIDVTGPDATAIALLPTLITAHIEALQLLTEIRAAIRNYEKPWGLPSRLDRRARDLLVAQSTENPNA